MQALNFDEILRELDQHINHDIKYLRHNYHMHQIENIFVKLLVKETEKKLKLYHQNGYTKPPILAGILTQKIEYPVEKKIKKKIDRSILMNPIYKGKLDTLFGFKPKN